jgi:flagellar biosynthetic protein FliQ
MSQDLVLQIFTSSMKTAMLVMSPVLLTTMVVGLVVSIFQAATQIHEMTLTFVPKILAVAACLLILFPWMLNQLTSFTINLFTNLPLYVR